MRRWAKLALFALVLGSASFAGPATRAEEAAAAPAVVDAALVEHHVIPRYRTLAAAARGFDTAASAFCAAPATESLASVENAFHEVADAWMGVQHIQFGPIELLMRAPRLYFWPDPGGRVARDVLEFVAAGDSGALEGTQFAAVPVSLQGLPAAEIVIFDDSSREHLLAGDGEGQLRCKLLGAIAANVDELARGLLGDWQDGDNAFAGTMATPGPDNPHFPTQEEVTTAFLKSLNHALRLAGDTRLKPVLGADLASAHPERAESRRSGRALRNVILSLEAAEALYLGEGHGGLDALASISEKDQKIGPLLRKAFAMTRETAASIDKPLAEAVVDPAERAKVEKLATQIQALRQLVGTRLAAALGLSVGFNALDGD